MKTSITYNKKEIMKRAWELKTLMGYSIFSQALKHSWLVAKNEAIDKEQEVKRNAIYATRKAIYEAEEAKRTEEYNRNYIPGPSRYYANNTYNGD